MPDLDPQLLIFGGSLIAILALAGLARMLGLGGNPALKSDADVQRAAGEVEDGFVVQSASASRDGTAALARNGDGRIIVIKRHGNHFAGRILTGGATAREEVDGLVVNCGEARFGPVRLTLDDASIWADRINRL